MFNMLNVILTWKRQLSCQKTSSRRFETNQTSAFGNWDLRRESIVRQTDSVVSPVERFEVPVSQDEDELETPPFFKNR